MVSIAIFGGTGMTGEHCVKRALEKGYTVRLLYRNEATVPESFKDNVQLIKGDATNLDDVVKTLDGVDRVSVILGTRNNLDQTTALSKGMKNIVDAMKLKGIRRVAVCLSSFLFWEPEKVPKQFNYLNDEHKKMLEIVKASGLDYIAVLPPHIANEPPSEFKVLHDEAPGRVVSKFDLANFLIDSLDMREHFGKVCGIAKILPQA